jgi:hypothetical protein
MARVKSKNDNQTGTDTTSFSVSLPSDYTIGDLLVIFVAKDDGAGGTISTPSGWTLIREGVVGTSGNNTCRGGAWYKIAASSSETTPVVTSTDADAWCGCSVAVVDFNPSNPINVSGINTDSAGEPYTCNAITTTVDNCLLLFSCSSDGAVQPVSKPGTFLLSAKDDGATVGLGVSWRFQKTAGSTGAQEWIINGTADESVLIAVAIEDVGTGVVPLYPSASGMTIIDPLKAGGIRTSNADSGSISDSWLLGTGRAVEYALQDRGGTFTDYTSQINSSTDADVLPFADVGVQQVGDAFYIGSSSKFSAMRIDRAGCTAGVGGVLVKEYWNNSAWVTLPNQYDQTSSLTATVNDNQTFAFSNVLSNWTTTTVNGQSAYWIRWRLTTVYTTNPTISQAWVGMKGLQYDALASVGDTGVNTSEASIASSPGSTGNIYAGATRIFGASGFDLSSGVTVGTYIFGTPRDQTDIGNLEYGGIPFCIGNSSNQFKTWIVGGYDAKDTKADARNVYAVQVGQSTDTSTWVSSTPPASNSIIKMLIAPNNINGTSTVYYSQLMNVTELVINGGTSVYPGTWEQIVACANAYPCPLIQNNSECYVPIRIGGNDAVYIDASLFNLTYPVKYNLSNKYGKFHVDDGYCGVTIYGKSGDTIKLRSATIAGGSRIKFEMHTSASASATYDFTGLTIVNANVTLRNIMTYSGMSFSGCNKIDLSGLTLTGCNFTNPGDGTGCSISTTSSMTNIAFNTATSSNYAIEIGSAGNYTLTGVTYTGFTTDINVTATTGTVNITVDSTGDVPTYTTAGATVNILAPIVAVSNANLIDGTRVQIYNITKDLEIDNSVVSGGLGYSYEITSSSEAEDGDIIRMRAAYVNGTTAKETIETQGVFSSAAGLEFIDTQTNDSVYTSYGIDGSTVTEFTADVLNIYTEIDDPDGETTKKRFYAWFKDNETTEEGIRYFFGGLYAQDVGNLKQDGDLLDLQLINVNATTDNLTFTDNDVWLQKIGGTRILWGAGITAFSDKVYIAETGTSGLTASESAQLFGLNTSNLDVAVSTRGSQSDLTAVKERTDNLPDNPSSKEQVFAASML